MSEPETPNALLSVRLIARYIRFRGFETNVFLPDPDLEDKLRDYEYYPWLTAYPEPLVQYQRKTLLTLNAPLSTCRSCL